MPEPTRCPMCRGPAQETKSRQGYPLMGPYGSFVGVWHPSAYRTTAPDPATVAAMRALLTVELAKVRVDDDLSYLDYGDFAEWWEKVRALLGPVATEGGG